MALFGYKIVTNSPKHVTNGGISGIKEVRSRLLTRSFFHGYFPQRTILIQFTRTVIFQY